METSELLLFAVFSIVLNNSFHGKGMQRFRITRIIFRIFLAAQQDNSSSLNYHDLCIA
jgi:hypothetical protein